MKFFSSTSSNISFFLKKITCSHLSNVWGEAGPAESMKHGLSETAAASRGPPSVWGSRSPGNIWKCLVLSYKSIWGETIPFSCLWKLWKKMKPKAVAGLLLPFQEQWHVVYDKEMRYKVPGSLVTLFVCWIDQLWRWATPGLSAMWDKALKKNKAN